jgi:hypothetical protein
MQPLRFAWRAAAVVTTSLFAVAFAAAPASSAPEAPVTEPPSTQHRFERANPVSSRTPLIELTPVQRAAISGQLLVGDPASYARAKARAEGAITAPSTGESGLPKAPSTQRNWQGVNELNAAPSDSTGAIGTQRYVELVNSVIGIYDRTNNAPIATDTLNTLTGAGSGPQVFDPQVVWDPTTNRFYYATDVVVDAAHNFLAFGFSKTTSPSNATTDWCKYSVSYGAEFPDYPKLGDLSSLLMIGANIFSGTTFLRSDVVGITKPPSGSTCPDPATFTLSIVMNLHNADASQTTTPLPVNQVDDSGTGFVLGGKSFTGGNSITVFNATKNAANQLLLAAPRTMSVPAFSVPAAAPQPGTTKKLDTLDTRMTNAVSAIDPSRSNQVAIWTQHTVAGGAGAQVRWYEINPTPPTPVPFQSGTQSSASLFLYNAAIAPDRRRNGATGMYGDGMLLHYSSSSSGQRIGIAAVSKVGTGSVTGETVLQTSPSVINDFSCMSNLCRWGDYSGASPDPASDTTQARGVVWGTNAWAQASSGVNADWRTQNFALRVSPK